MYSILGSASAFLFFLFCTSIFELSAVFELSTFELSAVFELSDSCASVFELSVSGTSAFELSASCASVFELSTFELSIFEVSAVFELSTLELSVVELSVVELSVVLVVSAELELSAAELSVAELSTALVVSVSESSIFVLLAGLTVSVDRVEPSVGIFTTSLKINELEELELAEFVGLAAVNPDNNAVPSWLEDLDPHPSD
jgi:hypothetical protein